MLSLNSPNKTFKVLLYNVKIIINGSPTFALLSFRYIIN